MTVYRAIKLEALFTEAVERDQGSAYRRELGKAILDCTDAYDDNPAGNHRSHFGISNSGEKCSRKLWYSWRWAKKPWFKGQILRLFNRGHLEEARFVALIRCAGLTYWATDANQKQFKVSMFGGHYGSAIDGVVKGIPDIPNPDQPALGEFKTHNEKSFTNLVNNGLFESKPQHYIQMQQYMGAYRLLIGLYVAVNKNTDEIYCELIEYDPRCDEYYKDRSHAIIFAKEAPPRYSERASDWECKFCSYREECHYGKAVTEINCRTCRYGSPLETGDWVCNLNGDVRDAPAQRAACADHTFHRDLVP